MLEVRLIGTFEVKRDGQPVAISSRFAQSLLAYLLLNAGTTHRREKLAGLFWPDSTEQRARASLRDELWRIRTSLAGDPPTEILTVDELTIGLNENASYHLDVRDILDLGPDATIADLISALRAYSGELLPGFHDDWAVSERGRLQIHFEQRITRLLELLKAAQRWPEMVDWAERWLARGSTSETAYRYLVLGHAAQGDRAKAQETYERCVRALDARGLAPSAALRRLAHTSTPPAVVSPPPARPSGTVTFLFSDIENSTRLAQEHRNKWETLRDRHHAIMRESLESNNGCVFEIIGDAFCAAFPRPADSVRAAVAAQRLLYAEDWGGATLRVRMGIHTGVAEPAGAGYRGYLTLSSVQRIMSAAHGGQVIVSQSAFDLLEGDLPDDTTLRDMGEHRLKDLLRHQHLYQVVLPDLPIEFPPLKSLDVKPHNLPVQLTAFIGRDRELAEIGASLQRSRLVTLTGLAGTGKTRLSLQVAAEVLDQFADGAWFVDLAPLSDPALVPQTIAAALKIREPPGRVPLDVLKDSLAGRNLLLILDNCEHLIQSCAQAADDLLRAAPRLRILATSRENLGVAGGAAYPVSSLPLPDAAASTAEAISHSDAVRLFIDRAEAVQPAFCISVQNAHTVAQICQRLDGIPLALELAAARAAGMTLEQIASRLDDRLQLLTGGSRTAPSRQRTLRATIDWSHDLLSEVERTLLRRLAVFVGGWTPKAARGVTAGGALQESEVEDVLSNLVEKSLVVLDMTSGRYRMLETVREYALERLTDAAEEPLVRARHLDAYVHLALSTHMDVAEDEAAFAHLLPEHQNLLTALAWCDHAPQGAQKGLQIMGATCLYWKFLAQFEAGYELTRHLLALPGASARTPARGRALHTLGVLGSYLGRTAETFGPAEESLSIAVELADPHAIAEGHFLLGMLTQALGEHRRAMGHFEEMARLAREHNFGFLLVGALCGMAEILRWVGRLDEAEPIYEESLALARQLNDVYSTSVMLNNLAMLSIRRGDLQRARHRLLDIDIVRVARRYPILLSQLFTLAGLMAAAQDWSRAALTYGAARAHQDKTGEIVDEVDQQFLVPLMALTREALGEREYESAMIQGAQLPAADALVEAAGWLHTEA